MFYTNQSIHHPDSPRHMDVGSWAGEHTVALRNQFDPRHVAVNGFDVTPYIDQIEQGVVALFPVTRNESLRGFRFIYKLPKGMYEQQGFGGGSIIIPAPELYISAYVELNFGSAGVRVNDVTMELGSPYQEYLPLSNIHNYRHENTLSAFNAPVADGLLVSEVCTGRYFTDRRTTQPTAVDAINDVIAVLPSFLFTNGNLDLTLSRREAYESGFLEDDARRRAYFNYSGQNDYHEAIYAFHIGAWLATRTQQNCRHSVNSYTAYWLFLHYVSGHPYLTIDDIYQRLAQTTSFENFFDRFGISDKEYYAFVDEYQTSKDAIHIYDEDDEDDEDEDDLDGDFDGDFEDDY